jgi:hypothetical protein
MMKFMKVAALATAVAALGGCQKPAPQADRATFTAGLTDYLSHKGRVCFDYTWPVNMRPEEHPGNSRNALQMPVLERLGLVRSAEAMADFKTEDGSETVKVRQYTLTDMGQKFYVPKLPSDKHPERQSFGLCAATLTLDHIVGWEPPRGDSGQQQTAVTYTFKIQPESWMQDAEALRVFPMITTLIHGAGAMQLKEVFTLTDNRWRPSDNAQ